MSGYSPGTQTWITPNAIFYCGSSFLRLYLLQNTESHKSRIVADMVVETTEEGYSRARKYLQRPSMLLDGVISFRLVAPRGLLVFLGI